MMWLWDMIGYGIIISAIIAFLFVGSPFFIGVAIISPPIASAIKWYAINIGNTIPIAIFIILSKANVRGLAIAAVALVISWAVINWVVLPNLGGVA